MRKHYVVSGATSGIGLAIAEALAERGYQVVALGRQKDVLAGLEERFPERIRGLAVDLTDDDQVAGLAQVLRRDPGRLDGLVLCAGVLHAGEIVAEPVEHLDAMYRSNLRTPYVLVQQLFPLLEQARGYVVFVNSSVGLTTRPGIAGHAAMQHALKALADTLRLEVNALGVRVLSVYPGRTATPRMERLFAAEGRPYDPALLLQPDELARVVVQALELPAGAELTDLAIRPTTKSY